MRVLITGCHGFVGTNLVDDLSRRHEIIRWDAMTDNNLPDCDAVIHLAGLAHDTENRTHEEEYFKVNTELAKKMYDKFLRSEAKKFIFFSSIKAKDNDTPYARSKKAAEDYILYRSEGTSRQARDDNASTGLSAKSVYILRPCMIHGKGVKGNLPLLFKYVKKGWPWPLAAFENQRTYASMGNVAFVVNELLKEDVSSGIYNICDDESVPTNELIGLMSKSLGCNTKMLDVPKGLVRFGASIGNVFHLPLNTERLRKLTGDEIVDNSKIKFALRINHMPISAMDGLMVTIEELMKE